MKIATILFTYHRSYHTEKVLESYIGHYPIRDIGIEEEEIGSVVERIYKEV